MSYEIGQIVPFDYERGIVTIPIEPTWYALRVPPGKEKAVSAAFKAKKILAIYPKREKTFFVRGRRVKRDYPIVGQVVYAKFTKSPQWDVMKLRRLITGVFTYNGIPIPIPKDIVRQAMGLKTTAEKLEAARRALLMVAVGDKAEFNDGPMAGHCVEVTEVQNGKIFWETVTGIKGASPDKLLDKIVEGT